METQINIAEILKGCPKGMELDCPMYKNVTLLEVADCDLYPIRIKTKSGFISKLTKFGQNIHNDDAKCVIFPKGKTTWEGFVPPCHFKVGDRIIKRDSIVNSWIVSSVSSEYYGLKSPSPNGSECIGVMSIAEQDEYELVPNKFDITTLKPFESRVLMRSSNAREWVGTIYSHYNNNYFFGCGMMCQQCIPYEGNEHLLGTTNDCDEYFKTW